jgi:hypothetical protein
VALSPLFKKHVEKFKPSVFFVSVINATKSGPWIYLVMSFVFGGELTSKTPERLVFGRFNPFKQIYEDLMDLTPRGNELYLQSLDRVLTIKAHNEFIFFFYRSSKVEAYHRIDCYFDCDIAQLPSE